MEDEDPKPGPSGIQRAEQDMAEDGSNEDSDSAWVDEDTDAEDVDGEKLTIDDDPICDSKEETEKGKIPESVLRECKKFISLDKNLDRKAKKNNMTSKQVKLILKHIFSSPQLLAMLRDNGCLTTDPNQEERNIEAAEPKMTRATVRTLTEAGDVCPWILNPATPAKEPAPEIVSLVTEEFPEEEEEDPEYTPDLDHRRSDDEDSFLMSESSDFGTPRTNLTRSSVNTPVSELGTPVEFKVPVRTPKGGNHSTPKGLLVSRNLQFELNEASEGYGTRSRRSMTEMNIEEIEQQFIPFDITPDMYDLPTPNDDYSDFLQTLYSGSATNQSVVDSCGGDDDTLDPEYNFPPDEENIRLKDPEELRDDRATKISRKELADLMAELLECASQASQDDKEKEKKKKPKKRRSNPHTPLLPVISTPEPFRDERIDRVEMGEGEENKRERDQEEVFTSDQLNQLAVQMQQHIQLVTQMRLLSSHNPSFSEAEKHCDVMLQDIHQIATQQPNSVMNQSNLLVSLQAIEQWQREGEDPVTIFSVSKDKNINKRLRYILKDQFLDFLIDRRLVYYPELLPGSGLVRCNRRLTWTESEDFLIALAVERISSTWKQDDFFKKINTRDLANTLHTKHLPAKSPDQIFVRIKNLRRRYGSTAAEPNNPVYYVFKNGRAPPIERKDVVPRLSANTLREIVLAGHRDSVPEAFIERILKPIRETLSKRPMPIEAKEVVLVEPDLMYLDSMDSDTEDTDTGDENSPPKRAKLSRPRRSRKPPRKQKTENAPKRSEPPPILPKTGSSLLPVHELALGCGYQIMKQPHGPAHLTPLRPLLCVDGNATPVSLSESDTPIPSSSSDPPRTPPKYTNPANPFQSPIKSPFKSPFKSPLKSLSNNFSKSPLKAASDRIIRKYSAVSPLKRVGRDVRRTTITPKRLLDVDPPTSPRTPPCRLRSPLLSSPRDNDQDTPTAAGRRKARVRREAEVMLALVSSSLETSEEKEARENKEAQEMFAAIQAVTAANPDLEQRYEMIIGSAGEVGVKETYTKLNLLLEGHPNTQELLLDLLSAEDAASLGPQIYAAHADRLKLKRFLLKLNIVYRNQPAYHAKVLKELEALSKDASLTSEALKGIASRLFRNNQHLLDEFLLLIPGIQPPTSMLPSPEVMNIPDDCEDWSTVQLESVPVPRSKEPQTSPSNIRFTNGSCYVMDGKYLKSANIHRPADPTPQ